MLHRTTLRVPVDDVAPAGVGTVAARVVLDDVSRSSAPRVLCCFPGGGMTSRYFELAGHDMAAHLAAQGFVVVAIDHPGVGDSDVPHDPWTLRPELVADVDAIAAGRAVASLGLDNPVLLGVGHSMGAMLVTYQQARHGIYRGLALFGYSGRGLPEVLTPDELAVAHDPDRVRDAIVELAEKRFGRALTDPSSTVLPMLNGTDISPEAGAALREAATGLPTLCGLTSMIPGSHSDIHAALDIPVFLSIAEHDIVGPPDEAPGYFPAAEVTLRIAESAHHNSNVAPTRTDIWNHLAQWAGELPGSGT